MSLNGERNFRGPENKYSDENILDSSLLFKIFTLFSKGKQTVLAMIRSIFVIKSMLSEGAEISVYERPAPHLLNLHYANKARNL